MFGYACDETPELMPAAHFPGPQDGQAPDRRSARRARSTICAPTARPRSPSSMTRTASPSAWTPWCSPPSTAPRSTLDQIRKDMIELVIKPTVPANLHGRGHQGLCQPHRPLRHRRPAGRHRPDRPEDHRRHLRRLRPPRRRRLLRQGPHQGGPLRRLRCPLGGEEPSWPPAWPSSCQVQLAYAIGVAQPVSVLVETFGTGTVADAVLEEAVRKTFDLRPTAIIRDLDLHKPIYQQAGRLRPHGPRGPGREVGADRPRRTAPGRLPLSLRQDRTAFGKKEDLVCRKSR